VEFLLVALLALVYARRTRRLGERVPRRRQASFYGGLVLLVAALSLPYEDRLFSVHMLQHVLLGDLAPLAIVAGLTGPVLRPLLALPVVEPLRVLAHPLLALPLWAANLVLWHLPLVYEAALGNGLVHVLEHACFFTFGALMWAPVVEVLPGPAWFGTAWKLGYMVAVRLFETVLGNVFFWSGTVFYATYADAPRTWGISAIADQGFAGGVMMLEGSLVTIGALAWLFLKLAAEGELRQQLLERGVDPRTVERAVRYGRARDL
jgi:putative membrane protein